MASILYRVSTKDGGYILNTVEKKGKDDTFVKPAGDVLRYYVRFRNTDPNRTDKKGRVVKLGARVVEPVKGQYEDAVVKALNAGTKEKAAANGQQTTVTPEIIAKSDRLTVSEAVSQWLKTFPDRLAEYHAKDENGLSEASIATYTKTAEDFREYCSKIGVVFMPRTDRTGQQSSDEVNADRLIAYKSYLRANLPARRNQAGETKDRQGTIVARFRNLAIFFSYFKLLLSERPKALDGRGILERKDMPIVNRAKKIREARAKQTETVIIYSDDEINAMLSAATVDEADLIKFLLHTGVRDKEAAHAEWSDIDWNATPTARLKLQDKPRWGWQLKDKEIRSIALNSKLVARLKTRKARQEKAAKTEGQDVPSLIFPNSLNNPDLALDIRIQKVVEKAKKAGFKWDPKSEVTMHKFRKTYATLMHRHGCDMTTVRDLLGHSDVKTTELYIASNSDKAAQVSEATAAAFGD
jgi:integrase